MRGDRLSNPDHHVARYARPGHTDVRSDGSIIITGAAFLWRKIDSDDLGLSVNWLDHLPGTSEDQQLAAIRAHMHLQPAATGRLAILQIGQVTALLSERAQLSVGFFHDPRPASDRYPYEDPSHSVIAGLPDAVSESLRADVVADLLAMCVSRHVAAKSTRR
jgi:hypothetical protein